MEKMYSTIQRQIDILSEQVGDSIFVSLLLIRQFAQEGAQDSAKKGCGLKELVLDNQKCGCIASIARVLTFLEPSFPFVQKLIKRIETQNVEEEILRQLICLLSDAPISDMPSALIYENHLRRKAVTSPAKSGDFYTPKGIAQCLAALLNPRHGTAYDPCCGSGSLLFAIQRYSGQNLKLYGQTQDEEAYLQSQITLALNGLYIDLGKEPANTLVDDQHRDKKFDCIIANPPFNSKNWFYGHRPYSYDTWCYGIPPRSNANFAWLQHILSHMEPDASAAVILPNGTLTTRISREAAIREAIVQNNLVEAIISLPPGLFYSTKIPCCIWLLKNTDRKRDGILFIDAANMTPKITKVVTPAHIGQLKKLINRYRQGGVPEKTEWYGTASLEQIAQTGFLLSPNLYVDIPRPKPSEIWREHEKLIEVIDKLSVLSVDESVLASVVAWKDIEAAKSWEKAGLLDIYHVFGGVTKGKKSFGAGYPMLDVKSVLHSPYVTDSISAYVDVTEEEKRKYNIKSGDVFLNRTSETAHELACCSVAIRDQDAVYSGYIKRLRPWDEQTINPLYASCYFRSEIYRWEIESVSTVYTTYASMDNQKLSKIAVYYPDEGMQEKIGSTLFRVYRYRQQCEDEAQKRLLKEFERLLIQQNITYPVLCIQNKEGDFQCK